MAWIGAVAVIVLLIWWASDRSSSSSAPPVADAAITDAGTDSGRVPAPEAAPATNFITEKAPPAGEGRELTVDQIAYCLAEDVRLGAAEPLVDSTLSSQVLTFNSAVNDYNSRCGNYRYSPSEKARAQAYVDARLDLLKVAGAARVVPPRATVSDPSTVDSVETDQPAAETQP